MASFKARDTRFFNGGVDHVLVYTWVRTDDQIQDDAHTPPLPLPTVYSGQFSRWLINGGQHAFTLGEAVHGAWFEAGHGFPADPGTPDTRMIYSCCRARMSSLRPIPPVSRSESSARSAWSTRYNPKAFLRKRWTAAR